MGFNPTDGVRRLFEDVPVRPDTRVGGEQVEDRLNTADHDEADTVGEEESPAPSTSSDYKYVTPSTVSDNNTGETGRAQRNAAHTSDLFRYERQPQYAAMAPETNDTAATTSTQLLTDPVAIAMEIPASHRMWPTTNPPIAATQIALAAPAV